MEQFCGYPQSALWSGVEPEIIRLGDDFSWDPAAFEERELELKESEEQTPKVLVVDDQRMIVDTITEILKMYHFRAFAAYDGKSALELAVTIRPDYLLTDVLMPEMNGMELAIAIRKLLPETQILLISGQTGISKILDEGEQLGYEFELIAKPVHPEKLIEKLTGKK
jgi:CheY-like chemotaxis protein